MKKTLLFTFMAISLATLPVFASGKADETEQAIVQATNDAKKAAKESQNAVDYLDGKAALKSTVENGIAVLKIIEEIKHSFL